MPDSTAGDETGAALLVTLVALSLLTILGLYTALNATTGILIGSNFESQIQATYAALAGLDHAAALLRGVDPDDVLRGPDGTFNPDSSYLSQARSFEFRNPLSLEAALSLDISAPAPVSAPDDGVISTGRFGGSHGTPLIPSGGIGLMAPDPAGTGIALVSRYFVKVTDNNGDPSELAADPSDSPFVDGDGIVIVRSMGLARTAAVTMGGVRRLNAVAIFESRNKRMTGFDAGPALVIAGTQINASLVGEYEIAGGLSPGIGTIDTDPFDSLHPAQDINAASGPPGRITGGELPEPSVEDITARIGSDQNRRLLLDPAFLWDFIHRKAPRFADVRLDGDQHWLSGSPVFLGAYDAAREWNAPGQDPKVTIVYGNLDAPGGLSGGGILIVTGDFSCSGPCSYTGLVIVMGSGNFRMTGTGQGIEGTVLLANLVEAGGAVSFGTPGIDIGDGSRIAYNRAAVRMASGLIPALRSSFREIAGSDP